jgi:hypothetical protein
LALFFFSVFHFYLGTALRIKTPKAGTLWPNLGYEVGSWDSLLNALLHGTTSKRQQKQQQQQQLKYGDRTG